jgi:hypothetical protein
VAGGIVGGAKLGAGGFAVGFDPFVIGITAVGGRFVAIPQAERTTNETNKAVFNKIFISLLSPLLILGTPNKTSLKAAACSCTMLLPEGGLAANHDGGCDGVRRF